MKRAGWYLSVFLLLITSGAPVGAIDTAPSPGTAVKTTGPLIVTNYSFSGHSLLYVQLHNTSDNAVNLDGWRVSAEHGSSQQILMTLSGMIAPAKYATVANEAILPTATFTFVDTAAPADPTVSSVTLLSPSTSNYLNEVVTPSISSSTPRVVGTPATFYFSRNISTSSGNYLTTFAAFIPATGYVLASDPLYTPPVSTNLQIVEVYPDSPMCSPFDTALTCADYVKIYNNSHEPFDLSQLRLRVGSYGQSSTTSNTIRLSGGIAAGHFASVPISLSSSGSWVWLEDAYGTMKYDSTLTEYPPSTGHDGESWAHDSQSDEWRWSLYPAPGDAANYFGPAITINQCEGLRISEIAANVATEDQFIEIVNGTSDPIDAAGCAVQTNRSSTKQHVLSGTLLPAEHSIVYIRDTELTLTKTTTGTVYLLSSDLTTETDRVMYDDQTENTSWALINDSWYRTYEISAGEPNVWLEYPPCDVGSIRNTETGLCNKVQVAAADVSECEAGKYRSPETNRCRAIELSAAVACDPGEYRSSETNRCRSLVSTASVLTPCAATQERSPETNRCRLIQAASEQAPCAANQERNPDTNRCRNKTSSVAADFPIESVAQTGEATLGWWAFGGVGTLAAGYAGWEWRREVYAWIKKLGIFGIGRS